MRIGGERVETVFGEGNRALLRVHDRRLKGEPLIEGSELRRPLQRMAGEFGRLASLLREAAVVEDQRQRMIVLDLVERLERPQGRLEGR